MAGADVQVGVKGRWEVFYLATGKLANDFPMDVNDNTLRQAREAVLSTIGLVEYFRRNQLDRSLCDLVIYHSLRNP